jgi:hypothetical protein
VRGQSDRRWRAGDGVSGATTAGRILVAVLPAGVLLTAALNGGSYGPVQRGELFTAVLWVLVVGLGLGLLPRYRPRRGGVLAAGALIALSAWTAVGLEWTESAGRTVDEVARTAGLAGVLVLVLATFGGDAWKAAAAALAGVAVLVCGLALTSRLAPSLLTSPLDAAGLTRRLAYPLNYWNGLGSWAAMSFALALAWSAHATSSWIRGAALAGACLAGPVAYLTYSRSSLIAIAVAVVGVVAVSRHRWQAALNALLAAAGAGALIAAIRAHPDLAKGVGTQGAGAVVAIAAGVVAACLAAGRAGALALVSRFRLSTRAFRAAAVSALAVALLVGVAVGPALADRAWSSFAQREESRGAADPAERLYNLSGIRRQLWSVGLDTFREQPLQGTGAGTYEYVWNRDPRRDAPVRDAHSLYIEALAEMGLVGGLLIALALGSLLVTALRAPSLLPDAPAAGAAAGCAGALLVFVVTAGVDWMWEVTAVPALALACGGLASAAGTARVAGQRLSRRLGATLAALVLLAVQVPVLVAAAQVRESRQAIRDGRIEDAVRDATDAIAAEPWAASGYLQRAVVLERGGLLARAARDAREATRRERTNWETWLILGRIDVERGQIAAGLAAARRARALNPRSPLFGSSEP